MRKMAAGKFKALCLQIMDEVELRREPVIITKHGRPVAKLVPVDQESPELFGFMKGSVVSQGDLLAPVGEAWDADA